MRELTPQEQRTLRYAAAGLAIYLVLFCGFLACKRLSARRAEYRRLIAEAQDLRQEIRPYQEKARVAKRLMEDFHMDPMTLAATSLVAKASAAIQKASTEAGVEAGAIRESATHGSAREAASIQFEGSGPVPAVLALLHNLQSTGYPLIVDTVQISSDTRRPGNIKVNLTIVILNFDKWKTEEPPNA